MFFVQRPCDKDQPTGTTIRTKTGKVVIYAIQSNMCQVCNVVKKHTVLCKSNESEMREFRSLSPRTSEENSPENSSVFSQCLERYFFKTKDENTSHFHDQNEISLPEG